MTLRRRLFGYAVVVAFVACLLTVGVGVELVRHRLAAQQLTALERQADVVAALARRFGLARVGDHVYRVGSRPPRPVRGALARAVLEGIASPVHSQGRVVVGGRTLLYAARATAAGAIVLVRPATLLFGEWRPFLVSLIIAGLGGVALAGASSWLLARRLTRPLRELAHATTGIAAGGRDIEVPVEGEDELAELADSFNRMAGALQASRDQQRDFLESVSHELKTPLTSIRGYAEALDDGAVAPADAAAVIGAEAGRLERLVFDLIDLARLQRAGFSVERHGLELGEVARRAVERHLPQARELSVSLRTELAGAAPAFGDPHRLLQATSNLIENALRVTPTGGSVTVSAGPGEIAVTDTGPGLAPEDLPHAFERFYLFERYTGERPVGSGLGLAIVHQLARSMGGEAAAENIPGGGARFTLRLPLTAD